MADQGSLTMVQSCDAAQLRRERSALLLFALDVETKFLHGPRYHIQVIADEISEVIVIRFSEEESTVIL